MIVIACVTLYTSATTPITGIHNPYNRFDSIPFADITVARTSDVVRGMNVVSQYNTVERVCELVEKRKNEAEPHRNTAHKHVARK